MAFPDGLRHIVRENEPLGPMTWIKIGGPARYFAEPTSEEELVQVVRECHSAGIPVRVMVADRTFSSERPALMAWFCPSAPPVLPKLPWKVIAFVAAVAQSFPFDYP